MPLHPGSKAASAPSLTPNGPVAASSDATREASQALELRRNIYGPSAKGVDKSLTEEQAAQLATAAAEGEDEEGKSVDCDVCGTDCSASRFHNVKIKDYDVCPACFTEGRFPSTMTTGDFVRLDRAATKLRTDRAWTDQETLLLLEGLEMFEDDWDKIADHVGTRTRDQAIAHFLQLPIEDPYLHQTEADLGPLQYSKIPFDSVDNPVLSVVAFLASVVEPEVAAKTAERAVKELRSGLQAKAARSTVTLRDEVEKEKEKALAESDQGKDLILEAGASRANGVEGGDSASPGTAMEVDGANGVSRPNGTAAPASGSAIQHVASVALGSAAAKAHLLASGEDAELSRLLSDAAEAQVRKLELKTRQFEELETLLEVERRNLEQGRQQLASDRLAVAKQMMELQRMVRAAQQQQQLPTQEELQRVQTSGVGSGHPPKMSQAPSGSVNGASFSQGQPEGAMSLG